LRIFICEEEEAHPGGILGEFGVEVHYLGSIVEERQATSIYGK
jgi:hypothetical protein